MGREFCLECNVALPGPLPAVGWKTYCRDCRKARSRRWAAAHDTAALCRRWREEHREAWLATVRRYKEANQEKRAAQQSLSRAVARGALVREPCEVCGVEPGEGHHPDYSKPLEVRWYCRAHHRSFHREEREALDVGCG